MDDIKSLGLEETTPLDKGKANQWLQSLLETYGMKTLRSKGFFCFDEEDYRCEFQAVQT